MRRSIGLLAFAVLASLAGPGAAAPGGDSPAASERARTAEQAVSATEQGSTEIRHKLQTARAQRDVVKTLCLNDKLNQIDVTVRSARERKEALGLADEHADDERASHELATLVVLRQRALSLVAEANQCVGEPDPEKGDVGSAVSANDPYPDPELTKYPGELEAPFAAPPVPSDASPVK